MSARFLMILPAVFVLAACSGGADKGGIDTTLNDGVTWDSGASTSGDTSATSGDYSDTGPTPGTQADLVVNVGDRVFFDTDSTSLTSEARSILDNQVSWLKQHTSLSVIIEGHADERGTREYNLALGESRANAVKTYLMTFGISPSRITTITFGKERPAVPGAGPSAWSQNRRGVTKVQ